MVAPKREGFGGIDDRPEILDRGDRPNGGDPSQESREADGSASSGRRRVAGGSTERLRDVLRGDSNGDVLLDRGDVENGTAQWLRALDLQALGACRADERLTPLLKLNISGGLAEDRLIAQLSQHFDVSEVGILARCLCVPLVSIRVGKVNKKGNLLCPTSTRGHLNLNLLPSSDMRMLFVGDDGCTEQFCVLSNNIENTEVAVDEISADSSGRSFVLKLPGFQLLYFWCSEKSKDHGKDLLAKMNDLLRRKPSLAHLTGICESRLDSFATHLMAYLLGSSKSAEAHAIALSSESVTSSHASDLDFHSSKSFRCRFTASHTIKGQPSHQGSLSPRPNTFKDGTARSSSSIRNGIKEKLRRRGDSYHSGLPSISQPSTLVPALSAESTSQSEDVSLRGSSGYILFPSTELPCPSTSLFSSSSMLAAYYCWCPPCPSALHYSVSPHMSTALDESLPLPPLSSLLSAAVPPVSPVTSSLALGIPNFPTLNLPALLPQSFIRLPIHVSLPTSQQTSTFTPYMSDPIVHTPVIDVCSSGQGYLVSAGPAISSALPPLLSIFVNHPLITNTEPAVEKSERETLRMLMAASAPVSSCQKPLLVRPDNDGADEDSADIPDALADAVAMGVSSMWLSSSSEVDDDCIKIHVAERNGGDWAESADDGTK